MKKSFTVALPDGAHFSAEAGENLLAAAQRAHWLVRYGCRNGNCAACSADLLCGSVALRDGNIIEAPAMAIFLCLCTPRSDLQIVLPIDPRPGSFDQSLRRYALLHVQHIGAELSTLHFTLPAGRKPMLATSAQVALIETDTGLLQAHIDTERSHGRELVVTIPFASPLQTGAHYYLRYPLSANQGSNVR